MGNLMGPLDWTAGCPELVQHCSGCICECFWVRLTFESVDQVKQITLPNVGGPHATLWRPGWNEKVELKGTRPWRWGICLPPLSDWNRCLGSPGFPVHQLQILGLPAFIALWASSCILLGLPLVLFLCRALINIPALLERFFFAFIVAKICLWWKVILTVAKPSMQIITWKSKIPTSICYQPFGRECRKSRHSGMY